MNIIYSSHHYSLLYKSVWTTLDVDYLGESLGLGSVIAIESDNNISSNNLCLCYVFHRRVCFFMILHRNYCVVFDESWSKDKI